MYMCRDGETRYYVIGYTPTHTSPSTSIAAAVDAADSRSFNGGIVGN